MASVWHNVLWISRGWVLIVAELYNVLFVAHNLIAVSSALVLLIM